MKGSQGLCYNQPVTPATNSSQTPVPEATSHMTIYNVLQMFKNFYYSHTYLSLAILAGLVIFALINPKATLKVFGAILILALAIYCATLLGKTSSTGLDTKKGMYRKIE